MPFLSKPTLSGSFWGFFTTKCCSWKSLGLLKLKLFMKPVGISSSPVLRSFLGGYIDLNSLYNSAQELEPRFSIFGLLPDLGYNSLPLVSSLRSPFLRLVVTSGKVTWPGGWDVPFERFARCEGSDHHHQPQSRSSQTIFTGDPTSSFTSQLVTPLPQSLRLCYHLQIAINPAGLWIFCVENRLTPNCFLTGHLAVSGHIFPWCWRSFTHHQ